MFFILLSNDLIFWETRREIILPYTVQSELENCISRQIKMFYRDNNWIVYHQQGPFRKFPLDFPGNSPIWSNLSSKVKLKKMYTHREVDGAFWKHVLVIAKSYVCPLRTSLVNNVNIFYVGLWFPTYIHFSLSRCYNLM